MNKRGFGSIGEDLACDYLESIGFRIAARNYRCGRLGEIDIIAFENEFICFIEVKTRTSDLYGAPIESVSFEKQRKIISVAWSYIKQHNMNGKNMRFDVVEITGKKVNNEFKADKINLIRNAFEG
jgi:putative endonuclease